MKKFLSLVLVLAMLASMIVINVSAAEVSVWDGSASEYLKGSGTKDDPYLIQSAADLKYFANTTNTTEYGAKYAGKYIVQTVDIDLNNITWTPISWKAENSFCGVYDGQGHTISNMKIDQNLAGGPCLALFGYIGRGHGDITLAADCGVANLNVTGTITAKQVRVAGLVGQVNADAYVNNTYKVYITNVTCDVDITVSDYASNSIWGGVAGYVANATFENVVNNGNITATNCQVYIPTGGIAGRAEHVTMIGCVNNGDITVSTNKADNTLRVGGIVGQIYKKNANQVQTFINCVNNGDVSGTLTTANQSSYVGGIVGGIYINFTSTWGNTTTAWRDYKTTFAGCVNTGTITSSRLDSNGQNNAGGILASCYPGGGKDQNHGGFKFYNCVNTGVVQALNESAANRAAGITSSIYVNNAYDFNIVMQGCFTGTDETGDGEKLYGNFSLGNSANVVKNNSSNTANAATVAAELSKPLPSTIDINGFNTGVDVSVWTGGSSGALLGSGTKDDPYLVRNANDLKTLANMVNGTIKHGGNNGYNINGVNTFDGKYIKQTADINLNNIEWLPIGFRETAVFQGVYDGDGHTVSGLKITSVSYRTGLFGGVGYVQSHLNLDSNTTNDQVMPVPTADCGIANLNVSGNITLDGTHGDRFYYGGVVSYLGDEKLENTYDTYLINVTSAVNVTTTRFGNGLAIGGVVGHAYNATLENVVNKGTVKVTADGCKQHTAGVIGMANSVTLKNCVNLGDVSATTAKNNDHLRVGGIVGSYVKNKTSNYMTFVNCYNAGKVEVTSTNESPSITLAGGILGGLWYNVGGDNKYAADTWSDGTTKWSDFKLEFINCTNTGLVSAETTAGAKGKTTVGGILSTPYAGAGVQYNNGGVKFDNCVNIGTINGSDADRATGISSCAYADWKYTFEIEFIQCFTGKAADYPDINYGHLAPNFVSNTWTKDQTTGENLYSALSAEQKAAILHTNTEPGLSVTDSPYTSSFGSSRAADLVAWNLALVVPSTTNINGMPTAAKVAVLTGVKNEVVDLPYAVPATMIVVDAKGDKVTNITVPGEYTVKVALLGITPYVTDMYALKYEVAYEKDYLTEAAAMNFEFGTIAESVSVADNAGDFNKYTTYGKTEAAALTYVYGGILPDQLNRTLVMNFVDGSETLVAHEYSLATYVNNQLNKYAEDLNMSHETKELFDHFLVDMIKYAAAAQAFRGYDPATFATTALTEEQMSLGSTANTDLFESIKGVTNVIDNDYITWTAATLEFDDTISIRLKFGNKDLDGYTFKVFVGGAETENFEVRNGYIVVRGFTPDKYSAAVTAYLVDADGNQVSEMVQYNVDSYIRNMGGDETYGELVQALANYAVSAQKYLSSVN